MKRHIRIERTLRALKAVCCVLKTMMSQSLEESRTKSVRAMGLTLPQIRDPNLGNTAYIRKIADV